MDILEEFLAIVDALNAAHVDYAVCGGLALSIHGWVRATNDIDLLIREDDVDRAKAAARTVGYQVATPESLVFNSGREDERRLYRISKFEGEDQMTLDLLVVTPFLETVWDDRQTYRVEGRTVGVVSAEGLVKMKRATGRKRDEADIDWLEGNDRNP